MAQYLQDTVERLARDWMRDNRPGLSIFTKEAIAYREGVASRLTTRMWAIRSQRVREEEAKRKAQREENAKHGIFTENALILSDVISTEEDLNEDHLWGLAPGTSAQRRKEREARQAAAEKEAAEMLRKQNEWDEAHPEEAAKRKAKEKEEYDERMKKYWDKSNNARRRKPSPEEERRNMRSFSHGYDAGKDISLDKQVDADKRRLT
jgi:hypothetical protein